jgi:hypothetical protein
MKKTLNTLTISTSSIETLTGTETPSLITISPEDIKEPGSNETPSQTTTETGDNLPEPKETRYITMTGRDGKTFEIIHPDDLPTDDNKTPISKRMDELLLIQMDEGTRTSGDHPNIKKHPKWMINPSINGKERWMDLTKERGWNIKERLIILTRNQTNFKEMNSRILGRIIYKD